MPDTATNADHVSMEDFIFGTLATDELRLRDITTTRRGLAHEHRNQPRDPLPGQEVRVDVTAGPAAPITAAFVHFTTDGSQPDLDSHRTTTLELQRIDPAWDTLLWSYVERFVGFLPKAAAGTLVRYLISGQTAHGTRLWVGGAHGPRQIFSYRVDTLRVPAWAQDAVMYHVFMDRFAPDPGKSFARHDNLAGFYGGTLKGVLSRLDYLSELGVDAVWLSPIFPSPSHHGYDWTDLREISPRFGKKADLKMLANEMHHRGMRLVLDYVPNHCSNEHPFFQAAITDPKSAYREFFTFTRYPDQYTSFFGVETLPQINNENTKARRYVIDSTRYWIDEFGVDGFRLDYALGPSHDFWTDYYAELKAANPDSFHFGEVVETPATLRSYEGVMDGALDFLWLQAARKLFAFGSSDPAQFEMFLSRHEQYFAGTNFILPSFLDNHDMNRFLWAARGDKRRLMQAAVCQFTLSRPPIIYYGTEIGLSQQRDIRQGGLGILEESRLPMMWDERQDRDLFAFYQKLIALRKRLPALRSGDRIPLVADPSGSRYGYLRTDGKDTVAVLFNLSDEGESFTLPAGDWRDALEGTWLSSQARLPARGFLIAQQAD